MSSGRFTTARVFAMMRMNKLSMVAASAPEMGVPTKYSTAAAWMHWLMAGGILVVVGSVKLAQWTPKEEPKKYGMTKEELMNLHKSTALLVAALVIPRLAIRLFSKVPPLPKGSAIEHLAANMSHLFLYFAIVFMPASGIAMGYYGGKGLPFFGYHISAAETPNKAIAGMAYKRHKQVGQALTYVVPIHVGATGYHILKGQNILLRMSPF